MSTLQNLCLYMTLRSKLFTALRSARITMWITPFFPPVTHSSPPLPFFIQPFIPLTLSLLIISQYILSTNTIPIHLVHSWLSYQCFYSFSRFLLHKFHAPTFLSPTTLSHPLLHPFQHPCPQPTHLPHPPPPDREGRLLRQVIEHPVQDERQRPGYPGRVAGPARTAVILT